MTEKKLTGILKIPILATVLVMGLMPLATADITSFIISPDTLVAGECNGGFELWLNSSTDMYWHNTSIPPGCEIKIPSETGVTIVSTEFSDASGPKGKVTILTNNTDPANPTVDVVYSIDGGDEVTVPNYPINLGRGKCFTIPVGGNELNICMPTETQDGFLNASTTFPVRSFRDEWNAWLCCPPDITTEHVFNATTEDTPFGVEYPVICLPPTAVPVYSTLGMAGLIGIMSVVLGFATMRRKR